MEHRGLEIDETSARGHDPQSSILDPQLKRLWL
jgi:hypothetical protein